MVGAFAEYFNNTEATRTTLVDDGWLRTGDLCYIDEDGYLFVVDRLKELIKYKGYQVRIWHAKCPPLVVESNPYKISFFFCFGYHLGGTSGTGGAFVDSP